MKNYELTILWGKALLEWAIYVSFIVFLCVMINQQFISTDITNTIELTDTVTNTIDTSLDLRMDSLPQKMKEFGIKLDNLEADLQILNTDTKDVLKAIDKCI